MKTNISNFSCWWWELFVGLVNGFLFLKTKTRFSVENFKSEKKSNHQHKKERERTPGVTLGLFSNDLTLQLAEYNCS